MAFMCVPEGVAGLPEGEGCHNDTESVGTTLGQNCLHKGVFDSRSRANVLSGTVGNSDLRC